MVLSFRYRFIYIYFSIRKDIETINKIVIYVNIDNTNNLKCKRINILNNKLFGLIFNNRS